MILYCGKYINLMNECRHVFPDGYFPFMLSAENEKKELDLFIDESIAGTRFQNCYKGNVVIDFSRWRRERTFGECFAAFLYYLADHTDIYKMVFISENHCSKEFTEQLEKIFDIRKIDLNPKKENPHTKMGFAITNDTEEIHDVRG